MSDNIQIHFFVTTLPKLCLYPVLNGVSCDGIQMSIRKCACNMEAILYFMGSA